MNLMDEVLSRPEFRDKPPVLIDIGAAGALNPEWKRIARFAVCIGFDADRRDLALLKKSRYKFRAFHIVERIISEKEGKKTFYLTRSPHCSSILMPDTKKIGNWSFSDLFQVEETVEHETVTLPRVLKKLSLEYVDWFKTDSQGTDLRLFKSLGSDIISSLIVAEFEPGIMDAYADEDKMHAVMAFMEKHPFWLSDLTIKGPQRITRKSLKKYFTRLEQRFLPGLLKSSAYWGEMTYLNSFDHKDMETRRGLLLGWVFCTLKKQHGFALELAGRGKNRFGDSVFDALKKETICKIRRNRWMLPFYFASKINERLKRKINFRPWT